MASYEKRGKNTYRLIVEAGYDQNGKRIKKTSTIPVDEALLNTPKKLKDHLDLELAKFRIEIETGEYISPEKMTFSAFVEEWRNKYALKEYAPKTMALTDHLLDNYIRKRFARFKMSDIKTMHIVMFFDEMEKPEARRDGKDKPFSASTRTCMHRILRMIFKIAVVWQVIKKSPMEGLKYPKLPRRKAEYYNEEESTKLFDVLQSEPLAWRALVLLAITTGLRRGEICGLEEKHINYEDGIIQVEQELIYTTAVKKQLTDTKTFQSERLVSVPAIVIELLKSHRAESNRYRLMMGSKWKGNFKGEDHRFVFTNLYGEPYMPEYISSKWKTFTEEKGLKFIKFHGLRHTSASLLINSGVHAKVISDRLGHTNINITMNTYGHVFRKADKDAANKFDDIFNPSPVRPQTKKKRVKSLGTTGI